MGLLSMKTVGEYLDGIGRALVPIKKSVRKIRKKSHRPLSERAFFQAADISRLTYSWKRQTASADAEIDRFFAFNLWNESAYYESCE